MTGFEGLLTGRTLVGRYTIGEVIGRGGFAAVYEATDERLGRVVAVKVITLGTSEDEREEVRKRFHREARASASLHHPNVVSVYDFGTDPELGLDFLVMERLRGEDLRARMRRGAPIPPPMAVRILREAADGVDAGHRVGLIHRDLKPGNIFLAQLNRADWFRVCVVDFGIARVVAGDDVTRITTSGGVPLSPAYASPEQLRGDPELSLASDVFSLGVIGYELLAGERPFKGDRLHPPPGGFPAPRPLRELNPAIPESVAQAIHRALAEDLDERFPDAGAFAAALATGEAELSPAPAETPSPPASDLAAAPAEVPSPAGPAIAAAGLAASAEPDGSSEPAARPEPGVASAEAATAPESVIVPESAAPPGPVAPAEPGATREPVDASEPVVSPEPAASAPMVSAEPAGPAEPVAPASRATGPRVVVEPALVGAASTPASAGPPARTVPARGAAGEARRPAGDGAPGQAPTPTTHRKRRAGGRVVVFALVAALVLALGWMALRNVGRDTPSSRDGSVAVADAEEQTKGPGSGGAAGDGGTTPAGGAAPGSQAAPGGQVTPGGQALPGGQVAQGGGTGPGGIARPPAEARRVEPGVASPITTPDRPATTGTATVPRVPAAAPAPSPAPRQPSAPTRTAAAPPPAPAVRGGSAADLNRQGDILFARGDIAGAAERFRAAVQAAPTNAAYRNNLGWALFTLGDIDGAGRELSETIRLDPRRAIAHANMGEVHRARGDIAAAIAAYERFLELNTDPRRERIARGKLRGLRGGS